MFLSSRNTALSISGIQCLICFISAAILTDEEKVKKAKTAGIENIANKGKNAAFIYIVLVVIAAAVIFFVLQIKIKPVLNPFDYSRRRV